MSKKEPKRRNPSTLGRALKIYREAHKLSQEQVAEIIGVEPRTVRRWETGEVVLENIRDLKQIADRLGMEYEHLGIAASAYVPITSDHMNERIASIWSLIEEARISEAYAIASKLAREIASQTITENPLFLDALTRSYHAIGHATNLTARTAEVDQAIHYYHQMEQFARLLKDDTLLNIALAYQGDMLRRKGDISGALAHLEAACNSTPLADISAQGNANQLLARAYLRNDNIDGFERAMAKAEEASYLIDPSAVIRQYNPGMVYEEYAKSYGSLGQIQKALDYVDRAEAVRARNTSSEMLIKLARAEILIHNRDLSSGEPLVIEVATHSRRHGHNRRLERVYALKRFLHQQMLALSKTEMAITEALEGPLEK